MVLHEKRVEALLDVISKFKMLPEHQQQDLQGLLNTTQDRFVELSGISETFRTYLDSCE